MKYIIISCLLLMTINSYGQKFPYNNRNVTFDSLVFLREETFNLPTDFSNATFKSGADFEWAKFGSSADFTDATFDIKAAFMNAQFDHLADFNGANFNAFVELANATFSSQANFKKIRVSSSAHFAGAKFGSQADFSNSIFGTWANFYATNFESRAYFNETNFGLKAFFRRTRFGSSADFRWSKFGGLADFIGAQFGSWADFRNVTFGSRADFKYATFRNEVGFTFATLPDTLYFSDVKTEGIIDFTTCENRIDSSSSENVCVIFLDRTDISKIRLNYTDFKLAFDEDSISKKGIANIYENLLKTQTEFPEGYKKLDIEYKEYKYLQQGLKGRIYNFLDRWWWNYSYDKEKVIYNTLILLVIFSIINWFIFEYLNLRVYKIDKVWTNYLESKESLKRDGIYFARRFINILPYSFYYTSLIFFGFKMNTDNINYRNHIGLFYLVFLYVVGIVDLLFIVNFVITST